MTSANPIDPPIAVEDQDMIVQIIDQDMIVPIIEERVHVNTRQVESGRARIHVTVSEHDERVEALLLRQDVVIERVARDTPLDAAPPVRQDGDVIVVSVVEERLVVEKRLFLKEELHIRINETRQPTTQTVRLRRETAAVDHPERSPA